MDPQKLQEKREENYYKFKSYSRSLIAGYHIAIYNDDEFIVTIRNIQFTVYDSLLLYDLSSFLCVHKIAFGCQRSDINQQFTFVL